MKFKGFSIPSPSVGIVISEPDQTVPSQALSLKEILHRFVRNEALPVAHQGKYGSDVIDPESDSELNVDLEKLKYADLTEKAEFVEKTKKVAKAFDQQEKAKAKKAADDKAAADKVEYESRVEREVQRRLQDPPKGGSI